MNPILMKRDPAANDPLEDDFDLDYYRGLTTAERFRMIIERSVILLKLGTPNAEDRTAPALTKRL